MVIVAWLMLALLSGVLLLATVHDIRRQLQSPAGHDHDPDDASIGSGDLPVDVSARSGDIY